MSAFKKLVVWQRSHALSIRANEIAKRIMSKDPRLADQLERAAAAVPAMIAEGSGLGTDKAFANSVSTAIGEISEVENHAQRGFDIHVLWKKEYDDLTDGSIAVRRMLIGLRRTLRGQPRRE
jgi:four helix bundle protein